MKVGIMQPYFFPYIGYFSLINAVDRWVVFDDVQYINKGWVNRNRIIHPICNEWIYITVPVCKHIREEKIKNISINRTIGYKDKILAQLESSYKKRATFFYEVMNIVSDCLEKENENLCRLNVYSMKKVCEYLHINFEYQLFSEMEIVNNRMSEAGEWALYISREMKADEYINPIGGRALFDKKKFENSGINLRFLKQNIDKYEQKKASFIEGLSIIDVMMFNSVSDINEYMSNIEIG